PEAPAKPVEVEAKPAPQPAKPVEVGNKPATAAKKKPVQVHAPKKHKTKKASKKNKKRHIATIPKVKKAGAPKSVKPALEDAEEADLTEEEIKEAQEYDLPDKPKIDVDSPEYKLQLQNAKPH